jgi:hypothetical protein
VNCTYCTVGTVVPKRRVTRCVLDARSNKASCNPLAVNMIAVHGSFRADHSSTTLQVSAVYHHFLALIGSWQQHTALFLFAKVVLVCEAHRACKRRRNEKLSLGVFPKSLSTGCISIRSIRRAPSSMILPSFQKRSILWMVWRGIIL